MDWLLDLHRSNPTAQAIAVLSLVCVAGMSLGSVQVRGIKLGTSGVLFAAIVVGHFYKPIEHETLEFVKEFGLILFVFCIGLQLGPGFFASLRREGLRLNVLAACIVFGGALTVVALGWLLKFDGAAVLGIYSGATTNTPSLGAAQQTLATIPGVSAQRAVLPALAYAVTYPSGIVGIIGALLAIKSIFSIDVDGEVAAQVALERADFEPLERRTILVENLNLQGLSMKEIPALGDAGVVVSRIRRAGESEIVAATHGTALEIGDSILVVGTRRAIDQFQQIVGSASQEDLVASTSAVTYRRVVLTNKQMVGTAVAELDFETRLGVVVTRVVRGDLELTAVPTLRLRFGDVIHVVGPAEAIDRAAREIGNSLAALNETQFVPLFAGISLGIALGTLPIACPGLPQPLRLGLAGGPLIVAIIVGRLGRVGRLVWHMPRNANVAFREFGIAMFFASVGLLAGPTFFATAFSTTGIHWLMAGVCVTIVPLLVVGFIARKFLSVNYVVLSGLLAGSMTDPPALAFASNICQSEAPAVAYAAVYPMTMLLRIMTAQALTVLLCG